jgi:N-acyl-D-aspartate/D-glutamate deacylase
MMALSRNESIPLEPMRVSMKVDWETFPQYKVDWETFPQYMDHLTKMPLGINLCVAEGVEFELSGDFLNGQ